MLDKAGMTLAELVTAFVEHDIGRHGLATLARGQRLRAERLLRFGQAVYPDETRSNRSVWLLRSLLGFGFGGKWMAKALYAVRKRILGGRT